MTQITPQSLSDQDYSLPSIHQYNPMFTPQIPKFNPKEKMQTQGTPVYYKNVPNMIPKPPHH